MQGRFCPAHLLPNDPVVNERTSIPYGDIYSSTPDSRITTACKGLSHSFLAFAALSSPKKVAIWFSDLDIAAAPNVINGALHAGRRSLRTP